MFGKYVATAVGYLLAVGPDKLSDGCRSIFSRKYGCVEKKNSRINKKNSRSLKKTQEPQIACLGSARLVTCCQLVQASSRMVVDRYFRENTIVLRKKNSRIKKKKLTIYFFSQEPQIACLGSARLVTCCQLVQTSSRMVVVRYFRENTIVLRKKTQEPRKKTQGLKKTQETQITCLGTARLVTCCQLVQTSSRMVVVRYFRENTVVLRKKLKNQEKKLKI